jgi:hypothetical protein
MQARVILTFYHLNPTREAVLPNIFQNGSNSTREATPPEESEPKPFFEEPEPCQTGPWAPRAHAQFYTYADGSKWALMYFFSEYFFSYSFITLLRSNI